MSNGIFKLPAAVNEPIRDYAPGSPERASLKRRLDELSGQQIEIPMVIGGEEVRTGTTAKSVKPHDHEHVLAEYHKGGAGEVEQAIAAAVRRITTGRGRRGTSGRPSSCARPSCWPGRGATRSTPPPCSVSRRRPTRPRSTRPAS